MSIRVTLNCQIQTQKIEALLIFLEKNLPTVRSFKGNFRVNVLFNKDKDEMLLDEDWLNMESHQAYLKFISENGVLEQLASFLSQPPKITYFEAVEI